jgi:putative pyruvate formate lyase activating enzyme
LKIVLDDLPAKSQIAKRIVFDFERSVGVGEMWKEHEKLMKTFRQTQEMIDKGKLDLNELEIPRFSLIDLKIKLVEEVLKSCRLCERACGVNRMGEKVGECGVRGIENCMVASEHLHRGEERYITPSHTIFMMGCNLHCQFCQNWEISQWGGDWNNLQPEALAKIVEKRKAEGARNVNWVGGEPTPHLLAILKTIKALDANTPQIWNSNFYMSAESMKLLDGVVDMYLSDFKYGNDGCARTLSKVQNYFEIVARNHILAAVQAEMTVRHLLLPEHMECCTKPVLGWLSKNIRGKAIVNIMDQYYPAYKAREHTNLQRTVSKEDVEEALNYARKLKLNHIS